MYNNHYSEMYARLSLGSIGSEDVILVSVVRKEGRKQARRGRKNEKEKKKEGGKEGSKEEKSEKEETKKRKNE